MCVCECVCVCVIYLDEIRANMSQMCWLYKSFGCVVPALK